MAELRQPRGLVKINDQVIDGFTEIEVVNNTFYEADTFRVDFPLGKLPQGFTMDELIGMPSIKVEIFAGFPVDAQSFGPSELQSLIVGQVDTVDFDPHLRTLSLAGRDYTARLIDTKTTEKYANQTASDIVATIAKRHGLTPVVTKTSGTVGRYYEIDHVRLTDARTEWDLLNYLAQETFDAAGEHFVVYVSGLELHFEPAPAPTSTPFVLQWQQPDEVRGYPVAPVVSLRFQRSLTVLRDVVVTVRSWNQKNKKGFTVTYPVSRAKGIQPGQASTKNQIYAYRFPNLTNEQALQKAQALYRSVTQHEVRLSGSMPGDNELSTRKLIQVAGTGTKFDQVFYPDYVQRTLTNDGGYRMTFTATNRSPESEVPL